MTNRLVSLLGIPTELLDWLLYVRSNGTQGIVTIVLQSGNLLVTG